MYSHPEWTEEDMPDTITYAVLTVDGKLHIKSAPSNPEFREDDGGWVSLYHNGPWDAIIEEIGGPCRRMARQPIGKGLMVWVSDESLVRPDAYPLNEVGGRTMNILMAFAQGLDVEPADDPWGGTIVITSVEYQGHDRWCGFIWPLDEDDEWLIRQAYLAAIGDDSSSLYSDDLDVDEQDDDEDKLSAAEHQEQPKEEQPAGQPLTWKPREGRYSNMWAADGPDGEWWYVVNVPLEKGEPPGPWSLYRRLPLPAGKDLPLVLEGEFASRAEAFAAAEDLVLHPTIGDEIRRMLRGKP